MPSIEEHPVLAPSLRRSQTILNRADEADDLLEAVKSLLIPYIRAADEAAPHKQTGQAGPTSTVLVQPLSPAELTQRYNFSLPSHKGRGRDGLLSAVEDVLKYSVNTWDQGFMDKLTASTNPVGLVAELVLGALNTNVHVYHVSPALTVIERETARKLAAYFGFTGPYAGGFTCQGGSASNLTSLVTARNVLFPDTKMGGMGNHRFAIFTSVDCHFSIEKAAVACGFGADAVLQVPVDERGCMNSVVLREMVLEAAAKGMTPLYVNATAGTTVRGMYDPIREIRSVCDEFGLWLHVDGSWGGAVVFSAAHRHKLDGVELADSVTISPHKMLNVPMTCSFILTNDLRRFHAANSLRAGYLFHEAEDGDVWDLADLTLQCGRRADSFKLALAWTYFGPAGFEADVNHAFDMAGLLTNLVAKSRDFELISENPPSCLQVCFYYTPDGFATDDAEVNTRLTREIAKRMVPRGFMFDFAPGPRGQFFRIVVNFQTLAGTVEGLVKGMHEVGREIMAEAAHV
ncbi:hypothetical protein VHEMI08343 [[Torrubiella] hemipterigena]|uniref:Glutamate decarboxylase n=1 Tax=[Torrubiella] hemipterigena TaxID=1531966 RepID=A0A0A1TD78_9HYPO|nr:hypothetical protein VHEMI08343 [[Torrubiella] hemipterigena]